MRVTVAIPCLDEAATIGAVVADFRRVLPEARVLVVDNGSSDGSVELARAAGAQVESHPERGKGHVVRYAFARADADACVLVDGDGTYRAEDVHALLAPIASGQADMVVGERLGQASTEALTGLRRFGNHAILRLINSVFRSSLRDPLSGFRVVSASFVKAVPLASGGFEIETELALEALAHGQRVREVPIGYAPRPAGSRSKLSPFRDGARILVAILPRLLRHRPGLVLAAAGAVAAAALAGAGAWARLGR